MARRRKSRRTSRKKKTRRHEKWEPVKDPGSLKAVGYDPDDKGPIARHRALAKAVRRYRYVKTVRKISFLAGAAAIPPKAKRNAKKDLEWLKEKYGKKRQKRR